MKGEWQRIETAPDATYILIWDGIDVTIGKHVTFTTLGRSGMWTDLCDDQGTPKPTHWMPLPEPPQ